MFTPTSSPNAGTTGPRATPSGRGPPSLTTTMGPRRWSSAARRCARSRPAPSRWPRAWGTWTGAVWTSTPSHRRPRCSATGRRRRPRGRGRGCRTSTSPRCARPIPTGSLAWRRCPCKTPRSPSRSSGGCVSDWASAPSRSARFPAIATSTTRCCFRSSRPVAAGDRLTRYDVREIVHYPLETTVAIAALIFGGVLERLPRLRIGFAHGGGTLPFLLGRFDHGWTVRAHLRETAPRPPAEYVRRLYVDSLTHGAATLRLVVETMAPGAVMMGSDYPLNMGAADPVAHVRLAGLDAMVEAGVLGSNARRFLGSCA